MKIAVKNIFAAVSDKSVLDPLLDYLMGQRSVKFWGTQGTVKYLKTKGFWAESIVSDFDFDGRVKSLDRVTFARILADRTNKKHIAELRKELRHSGEPFDVTQGKLRDSRIDSGQDSGQARTSVARMTSQNDWAPFDLVIIDLYLPDENNFPESMDIGGQSLIRAAIKNYKNIALAFDRDSITELVTHLKSHQGLSLFQFRKQQAQKALRFIAHRSKLEASYGL